MKEDQKNMKIFLRVLKIETPFFNSFEIYHGISVFCLMNYSIFKRTI